MTKAAILVDEINAMNQFHQIGIEGIRPWVSFYQALENLIRKEYDTEEVGYHIYGAMIPQNIDLERHKTRKRFFKALVRDGINVHKAFCLPNVNTHKLEEKGVDVLLGIDIVSKALEGIEHLFVFSADTDIIPAIQRAQVSGSRVTAIISKLQPATLMRKYASRVLFLEDIVKEIPEHDIVLRKGAVAL